MGKIGIGLTILGIILLIFSGNRNWQAYLGVGIGIIGIVFFLIGIIRWIIGLVAGGSTRSSSYSSSSAPSTGSSSMNWRKSRENDPHTCGNCGKYSATKGECRLNGSPKSAEDSCGSWQ